MKRNNIVTGFSLIMAFLLAGCASYATNLVKLDPSGPNVREAAKGDLRIYMEEYATAEKSERAFDTKLAEEGVLPLLILVRNEGQQSYEVKAADIVVRGDTALKPLTPEEAASKAKRSGVGRALGWSLIVPIISIPVAVVASASHTSKVNKRIVDDFTAKGFPDGIIIPNKERSGFVFFELEEGQQDLSGLSLEITAKNVATGEPVIIATLLPAATVTPTEEIKGYEEPVPPAKPEMGEGTPQKPLKEELERLNDLKAQGKITEDEYASLRKRLIEAFPLGQPMTQPRQGSQELPQSGFLARPSELDPQSIVGKWEGYWKSTRPSLRRGAFRQDALYMTVRSVKEGKVSGTMYAQGPAAHHYQDLPFEGKLTVKNEKFHLSFRVSTFIRGELEGTGKELRGWSVGTARVDLVLKKKR